jgi:tRNA dimethylallyltransferase
MQGVRHHLLDVADPKRIFSVDRYKGLGTRAITDILSRGKEPIICGGTGFYVDSLVNNTDFPKVTPNKVLRATLSKKSAAALFSILKKLDPKRAATIDAQNPVRLIRAIEIARALGHVPLQNTQKALYNVLHIGLTLPTETLKEKITARLLERLNKGMLREAKRLHTQGLSFRRMEALGLEYRYEARYLKGNISKERMIDELGRAIYHYAKRQTTWFKRNKNIQWFKPQDRIRIETIVRTFLQ